MEIRGCLVREETDERSVKYCVTVRKIYVLLGGTNKIICTVITVVRHVTASQCGKMAKSVKNHPPSPLKFFVMHFYEVSPK